MADKDSKDVKDTKDAKDAEDSATNPGTEAFTPDFSDDEDAEETEDTGTQSWAPDFSDDTGSQRLPVAPEPAAPEPAASDPVEPLPGTAGAPVQPVTVPGRYLYVKWWQLVSVLFAVWVVAAVLGLGLFYWWFHTVDKTPAVFVVLVYVMVCVVGGVLLAMVEGRPVISALALAVMSGPFASVAAAAPLYGYYFCERAGHCLVGVLPY